MNKNQLLYKQYPNFVLSQKKEGSSTWKKVCIGAAFTIVLGTFLLIVLAIKFKKKDRHNFNQKNYDSHLNNDENYYPNNEHGIIVNPLNNELMKDSSEKLYKKIHHDEYSYECNGCYTYYKLKKLENGTKILQCIEK